MDKKDAVVSITAVDDELQCINSHDVDEAMKFVLEHGVDDEVDPEKDRQLLWKIDLYLMPLMCLLYLCQFMDKLSNSYASILGLRKDLGMKGDMYSWTGTAFYLGYLAFEFPAVRCLQRFPVAKTVSFFVLLWGITLTLHSTPNYAGFIALRTILGMFESSVTPAFVIITGQYYKKEEVFFRTALWFSSNGLGTIVGSGIAYGLSKNARDGSIAPWKIVFIITGVITIALSIAIFFHLPDTPAKAWFLTEEEKRAVVARIRNNQQGFGNKTFKWYQFKEAFTDINTYLLIIFGIAQDIPNGGTTNFGSILLNERLGYSTEKSLLYQMPAGAVEFCGCSLLAFASQYFNSRLPMAIFASAIEVMALSLLAFCNTSSGQYAGLVLNNLGPLGMICLLSCISSNVAGHTKKTTVSAAYLVSYCVGNLIGPQTFLDKQAPKYQTATVCMVVFTCIGLALLVALYFLYIIDNKRRDAKGIEKYDSVANIEFADLTDKENPLFRYSI